MKIIFDKIRSEPIHLNSLKIKVTDYPVSLIYEYYEGSLQKFTGWSHDFNDNQDVDRHFFDFPPFEIEHLYRK